MKETIKHLVVCLFVCSFFGLKAQTSQTVSVMLNATVSSSPASITLSWAAVSGATPTGFTVYRKLKTGTSWGSAIATLSGSATGYLDTPVTVNTAYEYKVVRTATIGASTYTGYGYISTGIALAPVANRGILLLIIDSTFVSTLSTEIATYIADLKGDGWLVKTDYINRTAAVTTVKNHILKLYGEDSANTKAVMLLGHVPVPYSGNQAPDGHTDHAGAWPADVYYADVNGTWTDVSVNNTAASRAANDNIPGDGKFDQSYIADGSAELQVGRIDLANMPAFSTKTELQLLQEYLTKDHNYRVKNYTTTQRGLVDDNFGYFSGEAFAANGYRNLGPIVGNSNVSTIDYITNLSAGSYQWAYGCGGGSYTSASGIGSTTDFVNDSIQATFSMLFGSYFGDWDISNSFLRAPLCSGTTLTNVWGGRPNWFFHHMAMGENIGYSTIISQNNNSLYTPAGIFARGVHQALMGDLSLRNDVIKPASNLTHTPAYGTGTLKWNNTTETVLGYNIYVNNGTDAYTKLNDSIVTDSTYAYGCLPYSSNNVYVKAVKLHQSPSGTYYNESQGILKILTNYVVATISNNAFEGKKIKYLHGHDTCNAYTHTYKWYFGDGTTSTQRNPTKAYANYGTYTVSLVVSNGCLTDSQSAVYNFPPPLLAPENTGENNTKTDYAATQAGIEDDFKNIDNTTPAANIVTAYPNPSNGMVNVAMINPASTIQTLKVYNMGGQKVYQTEVNSNAVAVNLTTQAKGLYFILVTDDENHQYYQKAIIQ
jgi:PKD repeat protein